MTESFAPELEVSFRSELVEAARTDRSGILDAYSEGEKVGTAVLWQGRVVWATCRYQPEHLGGFLKRLGHVTSDQLTAASATYSRLQGAKKLGGILEESGAVSRPVLRRCLLLHIRMALTCLLRNRALVGAWDDEISLDEDEISFSLHELFPELSHGHSAADHDEWNDEVVEALAPLAAVPGYVSSVVTDSWGAPVGAHGEAQNDQLEASLIATGTVGLAESAGHTARTSGLGTARALLIEGDDGSLIVRWIGDPHGRLVGLRLARDGKIGIAKHKLDECTAALRRALASAHDELE